MLPEIFETLKFFFLDIRQFLQNGLSKTSPILRY